MSKLTIVKSEIFGNVKCDFYKDGNSIFMTRKQIGEALEYSDPQKAIDKIHDRHKKRLDKYSTTVKLVVVEGTREVERDMVLYSAKGVYEICRWSQQAKADAFYDFVYDILEGLRTGELQVTKFKMPQTYAEALRELAIAVEEREQLIQENALLLPKANFFDAVAESKDAIQIGDAAKVLNIKGIGRNKLFEFLRIEGVLMTNNVPYQRYIDCGYFRTIEQKYSIPSGETHISIKTLVYQKGLDFIRRLINEAKVS